MLVHNKGKYVRHSNGVMLVPGVNEIDAEQWEAFSKPKLAQAVIKRGEIVVVKGEEGDEGEGGGENTGIKDLNAKDSIDLIQDTFNIGLLEEWKEGEERKTVLEAIDKQIAHLKGEEGDEGEGGEA